jgi:hypothetical protein
VLPALLKVAEEAHARTQGRGGGAQEGGGHFALAQALAQAHHGYEELAVICERTHDTRKLFHFMRTLQGTADEPESFFTFMVARMLSGPSRQVKVLLEELPLDLNPLLLQHLSQHPQHMHLQWVQELRMGRYREAADTLLMMVDTGRVDGRKTCIGEQRHHLARAKLALLASDEADGGEADRDAGVAAAIEASAHLCDLQAEVQGGYDQPRMQLLELAHICLASTSGDDDDSAMRSGDVAGSDDEAGDKAGGGDERLVLAAFELFAIVGAEFCISNAALVEAAWGRAAELTDWTELTAARATCSDEQYLTRLSEQAVCQAAVRFYGSFSTSTTLRAWLPLDRVESLIVSHAQHRKDAELTVEEQQAIRGALHCGLGQVAEQEGAMSTMQEGIAGY